jgi:hypothetical protein
MPMYQTKTIAGILEPVAQQVDSITSYFVHLRLYTTEDGAVNLNYK